METGVQTPKNEPRYGSLVGLRRRLPQSISLENRRTSENSSLFSSVREQLKSGQKFLASIGTEKHAIVFPHDLDSVVATLEKKTIEFCDKSKAICTNEIRCEKLDGSDENNRDGYVIRLVTLDQNTNDVTFLDGTPELILENNDLVGRKEEVAQNLVPLTLPETPLNNLEKRANAIIKDHCGEFLRAFESGQTVYADLYDEVTNTMRAEVITSRNDMVKILLSYLENIQKLPEIIEKGDQKFSLQSRDDLDIFNLEGYIKLSPKYSPIAEDGAPSKHTYKDVYLSFTIVQKTEENTTNHSSATPVVDELNERMIQAAEESAQSQVNKNNLEPISDQDYSAAERQQEQAIEEEVAPEIVRVPLSFTIDELDLFFQVMFPEEWKKFVNSSHVDAYNSWNQEDTSLYSCEYYLEKNDDGTSQYVLTYLDEEFRSSDDGNPEPVKLLFRAISENTLTSQEQFSAIIETAKQPERGKDVTWVNAGNEKIKEIISQLPVVVTYPDGTKKYIFAHSTAEAELLAVLEEIGVEPRSISKGKGLQILSERKKSKNGATSVGAPVYLRAPATEKTLRLDVMSTEEFDSRVQKLREHLFRGSKINRVNAQEYARSVFAKKLEHEVNRNGESLTFANCTAAIQRLQNELQQYKLENDIKKLLCVEWDICPESFEGLAVWGLPDILGSAAREYLDSAIEDHLGKILEDNKLQVVRASLLPDELGYPADLLDTPQGFIKVKRSDLFGLLSKKFLSEQQRFTHINEVLQVDSEEELVKLIDLLNYVSIENRRHIFMHRREYFQAKKRDALIDELKKPAYLKWVTKYAVMVAPVKRYGRQIERSPEELVELFLQAKEGGYIPARELGPYNTAESNVEKLLQERYTREYVQASKVLANGISQELGLEIEEAVKELRRYLQVLGNRLDKFDTDHSHELEYYHSQLKRIAKKNEAKRSAPEQQPWQVNGKREYVKPVSQSNEQIIKKLQNEFNKSGRSDEADLIRKFIQQLKDQEGIEDEAELRAELKAQRMTALRSRKPFIDHLSGLLEEDSYDLENWFNTH